MTAKILEALAKLDSQNENHWTDDGSPRMDTLKFMTGDQTLTRESVTAASPGFSRASALEALKPATAPTASGSTPPAESGDASSDQGTGDEGQDVEAKSEEEARLIAEDQAAKARVVEAAARKAEADKNFAQAMAEADRCAEALEKSVGQEPLSVQLTGYFAQQQRQRDERAAQKQRMKDMKIDLSLLIPKKAPIDNAMARKNTRGAARPNHPKK